MADIGPNERITRGRQRHLQRQSGSTPHDAVTADQRQLRYLPSPLARRRPRPNSHPSSGSARIGAANPVVQRADRSFTPMRPSSVYSKPTATPASVPPPPHPPPPHPPTH